MKLSSFLKNKWAFLLLQSLLIAFEIFLFKVLNISYAAAILLCAVFTTINATSLAFEYVKKSHYYKNLYQTLEQMDKKQYISSVIESPDFTEAEILVDILKQATKAMNDEIAFYERKNEDYREYIETWIHEVKTPIACISLLCENSWNETSANILNEATKIDYFVEQALYYARSTNVEKDYNIHSIHIESAVKSSLKKYSRQLIATNCSISFENLDFTVYSDKKWLDFILGQLISNSIKYRSNPFALAFSASESQSNIILSIHDNGIGIPESDLSRVFEKSFTGVNGRKFGKSTGIGLYLCKRLCEKMNLKLEIESSVKKDTTLRIIFPKDKSLMFE